MRSMCKTRWRQTMQSHDNVVTNKQQTIAAASIAFFRCVLSWFFAAFRGENFIIAQLRKMSENKSSKAK